jgi:ADP-heptose:LPS heptosyltransferase/glycosyltransferase involved in cell wall biosynthesis
LKAKLLIVELWGLGDLVIATPFIRAAAEKFEVTVLAKPYAQDLQKRFWPNVTVVPFTAPWTAFKHKYRLWMWPWRDFRRLRKVLKGRFDVGLSARWDPRDHFLLALARTPRRLGFPRIGSAKFLTDLLKSPEPAAHRYEYWRTVAEALGLKLPARNEIPISPARSPAEVLVHSGAAQSVRVWPLERYQRIVSRLRENGFQVRVLCDPDQERWWEQAGEKSFAAPTSVTELLQWIDGAGVFIGNDSGPGHLAALSGVPTFTVFGPQLPERFSPLHPDAEWVEGAPCPYKPCRDNCRFPLAYCLWNIKEELVWPRLESFVGKHRSRLAPGKLRENSRPRTAHRTVRPRRFIQVFNRYLKPGGEENSVTRIAAHFESAGHQVVRFWRTSDEWRVQGAPSASQKILRMFNNKTVLDQLREIHLSFKPDAWIFHNVIPVVSLGVYKLARDLDVPIIQWLHNYRPISPSGTLRAGDKALNPEDRWLALKESWHGTWHGRFATAMLALGYMRIKRRGDFNAVKAWVPVSDEMCQVFERGGFPRDRLFVMRHSWDTRAPVDLNLDEGYFLFMGRMVEEKGARFLINLWQREEFRGMQLVMAGQGHVADELRGTTPPNIRWAGFVRDDEKRRLIAGCRALVFPCLWSEPYSTVVYEAYEQGKPVLATGLGGMKENVFDRQTGRLLPPGDDKAWMEAILEYARDTELSRRMGLQGLDWLQREVSPDAWNSQFDSILAKVFSAEDYRACG